MATSCSKGMVKFKQVNKFLLKAHLSLKSNPKARLNLQLNSNSVLL